MTPSAALLHSIASNTPCKPVQIPDGSLLPVTHTGKVSLSNNITLNNVLCVPGFTCNLLSVSKLTRDLNCAVIFLSDFCVFQDLISRRLIGVGKMRDGIYHCTFQNNPVAFQVMRNPNHSLWHLRLDHISPSRLSKISNISSGLSFNSHQACNICHCSKQTHLPFPISYNKSSECFS